MSNTLPPLIFNIAMVLFVLLIIANGNTNLKKILRSKQFLMPVFALLYAVVAIIFIRKFMTWYTAITMMLARLLTYISFLNGAIANIGRTILEILENDFMMIAVISFNIFGLLAYIIVKKILLAIFRKVWKPGNPVYEKVSEIFYEYNEDGNWYVSESTVQARKFLKVFYIASIAISILALYITMYLYMDGLLQVPFLPILGFIVIGELYFYIDGITEKEAKNKVEAEADTGKSVYDYSLLRRTLRTLFGDKLLDENTTRSGDEINPVTTEETLEKYRLDDDRMVETYAKYMDAYRSSGHAIDQNYLSSGYDLLHGKSILFNNPFYYDLVPYIFYAMNHELLKHGKVLLILGRHGIEDDIKAWCSIGLRTVSNVEGLWRIGVLSEKDQDLDVGIITRSGVQNLDIHKVNADFFEETTYVVIVEPSRLVTTAQIGLNSLVRYCKADREKQIVFCAIDKNCDGLVDALSHALMTSISEVSATETHEGTCSYMCWEADEEPWQHRMLPNISRYLGVGTELSFAAIKNQVSKTVWYGGEKFPVTDMHWIAKQYYGDLLNYASLPSSQEVMDSVFKTSPNMWDAKKSTSSYITVEDEMNNVFEMKRNFSTRTNEQSFVNIVSSPYLLCDYMTSNNGIFNSDSKAIPYIVADYVSTKRNALLRLCVEMVAGFVWEVDARKELMISGIVGEPFVSTLWNELCRCYSSVDAGETEIIKVDYQGKEYSFDSSVVVRHRKYNVETGKDEVCYRITNSEFIKIVLGDLMNAKYIAEDEGDNDYIGTESLGQIFQKYLPGQFFTLNGKFYEMITVTFDGRIKLRRAADHIGRRPSYRQERNYVIKNAVADSQMGSQRIFDKMEIARLYADITVDTPAYWDMPSYNDFVKANRIEVNGIPRRSFNNKWILRLSFHGYEGENNRNTLFTLASMMNEVFRTLFADNQDMIIATIPGEPTVPLTYGLSGSYEDFDNDAIYIIEDCQYDLGLLTAVERNINRIMQIICDYLRWNKEEIEKAEKEADAKTPDYVLTDEQRAEEEKADKEKAEKEKAEKEKAEKEKAEKKKAKKEKADKKEPERKEPEKTDGEPGEGTENKSEEKKKGFFGRLIDKIKNLFGKKETPEEKTPEEKTTEEVTPEEKISEEETSEAVTSTDEKTEEDTSEKEKSEEETPKEDVKKEEADGK